MKRQTKIMTISIISLILVVGVVLIIFYRENLRPDENNETNNNTQIPDPAGYYCKIIMGYDLKVKGCKGGECGFCIFPDKSECDEWDFYAGICGQNWSYCKQNGYDIETKNDSKDDYSLKYSVCVDKSTKEEIGSISKLLNFSERFNSNGIPSSTPTI